MSDSEEKAIGQFLMKVGSILGVFDLYGQGVHIPPSKEAIKTQALELHQRLKEIEQAQNHSS